MWFHRPFRADQWLLYDQVSPSASSALGLSTARLFQDGELVCTVAQEGLIPAAARAMTRNARRRSARVLLFDDQGRLVLIRRTRPTGETYLTTPGGGVGPDETWEVAAARECAEELGAEVLDRLGRVGGPAGTAGPGLRAAVLHGQAGGPRRASAAPGRSAASRGGERTIRCGCPSTTRRWTSSGRRSPWCRMLRERGRQRLRGGPSSWGSTRPPLPVRRSPPPEPGDGFDRDAVSNRSGWTGQAARTVLFRSLAMACRSIRRTRSAVMPQTAPMSASLALAAVEQAVTATDHVRGPLVQLVEQGLQALVLLGVHVDLVRTRHLLPGDQVTEGGVATFLDRSVQGDVLAAVADQVQHPIRPRCPSRRRSRPPPGHDRGVAPGCDGRRRPG